LGYVKQGVPPPSAGRGCSLGAGGPIPYTSVLIGGNVPDRYFC
jgi:hypothetical protein